MNKKEALSVVRARNKARKKLERCQDALWSAGAGTRDQRIERLKIAESELKDLSGKFGEALKFFLGGSS